MPAKQAQIRIEREPDVRETATVRHFDEIDDSLQETVVSAHQQGASTMTVDPFEAALLDECDCEVVKFTDYYRLSRV